METPGPTDLVTVYWRPGCPYCSSLRRGLRRAGVATAEVNIWDDPSAAATVRRLAGGNETVPTVVVGEARFVNPSLRTVLGAIGAVAPALVGNATTARGLNLRQVLQVAQWVVVVALIVASFAVEAGGHAALSWGIDGATLVVYVAFRAARLRFDKGGTP